MGTFVGTSGNDNFAGTAADDQFNYGSFTYSGATIVGGLGNDTFFAGGGNDTLRFANLDYGNFSADRAGDNLVIGFRPTPAPDGPPDPALGSLTLVNFYAADGSGLMDRIEWRDAYALCTITAGVFRAELFTNADVLFRTVSEGTPGADSLVGSAVGDNLGGLDGNDTLAGLAGDDNLNGHAGNDRLAGGTGNDDLSGDQGDDTLAGDAGDDTLSGGDGLDTVDYRGAGGPVVVNLQLFSGKDLGAGASVGTDTLYFAERVIGSNFADQLAGNGAFAVTLDGAGGNDTLAGSAVGDSLLGGAGFDVFLASASGSAVGGLGNDTMDGGAIADRLNYLDGNSVLYTGSANAVTVNLQTGLASDGVAGTDTLRNIDFVTGSAFNDSLVGSTQVLFESFTGGAGNDTIDGGAITDTLNGLNTNRAEYNTIAAAVTVDLLAGTATGQGNDVLINIAQVRGSSLADTLRGSNRSDVGEGFEGMGGNDLIDGRGGFDLARYQYAANGVNVNLVTGVAVVSASDQDTLVSIEGVRGSNFNDTLTGGNAASAALEVFLGNGGNDLIDGGAGYDRVDYTNSMQAVVVQLRGTADGTARDGVPVLNGQIQYAGTAGATTGIDTLRHIEAVRGSDFNDILAGSDIATQETFEGRRGNDRIDGAGGLDRASYFTALAGVTVTLGANGAAGTAADGYGTTDTLRNIENVQGSRDFADRLNGNELANSLDGQGGNDTLVGGLGNDLLAGGAGNDLLLGGAGNDILAGGAGRDFFRFTNALSAATNVDRISDFVAADDTVQLDDAVFAGIGAPGALAVGAFRAGTAAGDASDRVVYDSATGRLYFDADGNGAGAQVLFATVTAGTALTAADFVIV